MPEEETIPGFLKLIVSAPRRRDRNLMLLFVTLAELKSVRNSTINC